jgi:hypothetical protein
MAKEFPAMELHEFVKATLEQIVKGVLESQENVRSMGGVINPDGSYQNLNGYYHSENGTFPIIDVNFRVGISYQFADQKNKIQITVPLINVEVAGEEGSKGNSNNQIEFYVPIVLPTTPRSDKPRKISPEELGWVNPF